MVRVSGYTRSNGTYVRGYTRTPSSNSSSNKTFVSGYYKNDGTYVNGYTRSSNSKSSNEIKVKGYYRKNGTYVKGYIRSTNKSRISNISLIIKKNNLIIPTISYDMYEVADIFPDLFNTDDNDDSDINNEFIKLHDMKNNYKIINDENVTIDMICPISQELMFNPVKTKCSHSFDKDFLYKWLSKNDSCPLCRSKIDTNDLIIDTIILKKLETLEFIIDINNNSPIDEIDIITNSLKHMDINNKINFITLIKLINN